MKWTAELVFFTQSPTYTYISTHHIFFYSRLKASLENKGKKGGGRKKKGKRTKKDKNGDIIEVSGSEDEEEDDDSECFFRLF